MGLGKLLPLAAHDLLGHRDRLAVYGMSSAQIARTLASKADRRLLASSPVTAVPPGLLARTHTVIDVGANVGLVTEVMVRFVGAERVLAFEPSPEPYEKMRERMTPYPAVHVHDIALAETDGTMVLHRFDRSQMDSLRAPTEAIGDIYDVATVEEVTVRTARLDTFLEGAGVDQIDLLKIDVQGGEMGVLLGATEALKRTLILMIEVMFVEQYQGETLFPELHAFLSGAGFAFHSLVNLAPHRNGRLVWADAIYVR